MYEFLYYSHQVAKYHKDGKDFFPVSDECSA